jgi:hypothetical protein
LFHVRSPFPGAAVGASRFRRRTGIGKKTQERFYFWPNLLREPAFHPVGKTGFIRCVPVGHAEVSKCFDNYASSRDGHIVPFSVDGQAAAALRD